MCGVDDKVALAIELERATLAVDERISGIESAEYVDTIYEAAVAAFKTLDRLLWFLCDPRAVCLP